MGSKRAKRRRKRARTSKLIDRQVARRGGRTGGSGGRIPIRTGAASGGIATAARAAFLFARSRTARRLANIARQRISRIPGIGRLLGRTRRARGVGPGLVTTTGRQLATRPTTSVARRVATTGGKIAAGGLAFEAGSTLFAQFAPGGNEVARRIQARGRSGGSRGQQQIPFTPGGIVPTDSITHTWVANGVPFAQLADGRVMVRRKNGTIKTFRRPRPIVLGRNPGVRDIVRADKKIEALLKVMRKRLSPARRPRAPQHSQAHN